MNSKEVLDEPLKFNFASIKRIKKKDNVKKVKEATAYNLSRDIVDVTNLLDLTEEDLDKYTSYASVFNETWFGLYKNGIEFINTFTKYESFKNKHYSDGGDKGYLKRGLVVRIVVISDRGASVSSKDTIILVARTNKVTSENLLFAEFAAFKLFLIVGFIFKSVQNYNITSDPRGRNDSYDEKYVCDKLPIFIIQIKYNNSWYKQLRFMFETGENHYIDQIVRKYKCNLVF